MTKYFIVGFLVYFIAVAMTMVGKGGGNFYVVVIAFAGIHMHEAAATGQFVLFSASVAAMIVFQKNKYVSWKLSVPIGAITALSALGGGYSSHLFSGFSLKLIFAGMLLTAGIAMLIPVAEKGSNMKSNHLGIIPIQTGNKVYSLNLWIALPVTILSGFVAGMVGVSGGSFLVPLLVLACGASMYAAVGTTSVLIAATALMGFLGHAVQGDFNPSWALPLALVAFLGGLTGGKLALKTKPEYLKKLFAYTNWIAALFMVINALYTKGIL